jgi:hypothetical protein
MLTGKRRILPGLIAAIPLVLAGCKDNSIANPLLSAAGTYQLTLFRGKAPPVTDTYAAGQVGGVLANGGTVTWTSGSIVLSNNGTFMETNNYTITPTGGSASSSAFISTGTYTVTGTTFTLTAPVQNGLPSRNATGTIDATTITYQEASGTGFDTYQYKR